jgi:hypothetical protein
MALEATLASRDLRFSDFPGFLLSLFGPAFFLRFFGMVLAVLSAC